MEQRQWRCFDVSGLQRWMTRIGAAQRLAEAFTLGAPFLIGASFGIVYWIARDSSLDIGGGSLELSMWGLALCVQTAAFSLALDSGLRKAVLAFLVLAILITVSFWEFYGLALFIVGSVIDPGPKLWVLIGILTWVAVFFGISLLKFLVSSEHINMLLKGYDVEKPNFRVALGKLIGAPILAFSYPRRSLKILAYFLGSSAMLSISLALIPIAASVSLALYYTDINEAYRVGYGGKPADFGAISNIFFRHKVLALEVAPVFAALALWISYLLRKRGRWAARLRLEEAVELDDRPPILFLRPFRDDQVKFPRKEFSPFPFLIGLTSGPETLDTILVEEFCWAGPIVALGRPGDSTLPFGAARKYVDLDKWESEVVRIAAEAAAIVIVLDETDGIRREAEFLFQEGLADKTLAIVHPKLTRRWRESPLLLEWLRSLGIDVGEIQGSKKRFGRLVRQIPIATSPDSSLAQVVITSTRITPQTYRLALRFFFRSRFGSSLRTANR